MPGAASIVAVLAALLPTALGQANQSYVDYNTEANPDLFPECLETGGTSFPDCESGPLSKTLVCDTSAKPHDRAAALVSLLTFEELVNNTANTGHGAPRIGLPAYQVWNEALHGVAHADFSDAGDFSWSTSFPQPISTMAALNRTLIHQIATIISTQGRAFMNAGRFGLDVYSPNINTFRHPVWGRGQETPGEDAYCLASTYAYEYITGIQGGVDANPLKLIATAKHYAGYDIENWANHSRLGNDMQITQQDLAEYYTPQFLVASRDAKVHSVMCSYNAVNGVPSCSNSFFLQTLLRDSFDFVEDGYVSGDCGAVYNVFNPHGYAANESTAAADSIRAGTDIDCGVSYPRHFQESFHDQEVSRQDLERGVTRLYTNLIRAGYFDSKTSPYRNISWSDVLSTNAQNLTYEAAAQSIVLLKNDGILPLSTATSSSSNRTTTTTIALIGPWANATTQMQGNYFGPAPYLISPLQAFQQSSSSEGYKVTYAIGTNTTTDPTPHSQSDALTTAQEADIIIFAGGIDNTLETETQDRANITWPSNQLSLITKLADLNKPLIVLQMGAGQVDSSALKANKNVNALIWGGYPGQSGGLALRDIITGERAPAARLVTTQYPADYAEVFPAIDMGLRPNGSNPGQTYMWYTGTPVYEFGHGLFYTTFSVSAAAAAAAGGGNKNRTSSFNIEDVLARPHPGYKLVEQMPLFNFTVDVTNTGDRVSDYTAMAFINTTTAGPAPYPNKWLVGFDRLSAVEPGSSKTMVIPVTVDSLARTDELGNRVLYPGRYEVALNNERDVVLGFTLTGEKAVLFKWPKEEQLIAPQ
ncbi:putative exo-1,4-beta-xylosidase xlnD [Aspergillus caelatus]|uniref:xylan 1,4-beta-xylosidase n=1 Tax=Aspergillus caelatus TaxID=61420 RepID=A0A5N7AC25_9EURO|nr:putative exo-1,4-beta-xylosidase xlnD [Aspergillus caelatus]KAE8367275.1 putative exo-1,4-beta-xylosidase xlnD [Aspergillus caelatus]